MGMPPIPKFLRRKKGRSKVVAEPEVEQVLKGTPMELPYGVRYQSVYYVRGAMPRNSDAKVHFYIKDPPTSGQSRAFVLGDHEARLLTVFCPFTLQSQQVPQDAGEVSGFDPLPMTEEGVAELVDLITRKWNEFVGMGFQRDYDVAALVLTKLDAEVPKVSLADVPAEGVHERKERRGGKPHEEVLLKPVGRKTKRGQVAEFFLGSEQKSIRECMARLSMTRNSVLSALHVLHKDHGLRYETVNDTANILIPIDWDIWAE